MVAAPTGGGAAAAESARAFLVEEGREIVTYYRTDCPHWIEDETGARWEATPDGQYGFPYRVEVEPRPAVLPSTEQGSTYAACERCAAHPEELARFQEAAAAMPPQELPVEQAPTFTRPPGGVSWVRAIGGVASWEAVIGDLVGIGGSASPRSFWALRTDAPIGEVLAICHSLDIAYPDIRDTVNGSEVHSLGPADLATAWLERLQRELRERGYTVELVHDNRGDA